MPLSDESRFQLRNAEGRLRVWCRCRRGERHHSDCLVQTGRWGGVSECHGVRWGGVSECHGVRWGGGSECHGVRWGGGSECHGVEQDKVSSPNITSCLPWQNECHLLCLVKSRHSFLLSVSESAHISVRLRLIAHSTCYNTASSEQ